MISKITRIIYEKYDLILKKNILKKYWDINILNHDYILLNDIKTWFDLTTLFF